MLVIDRLIKFYRLLNILSIDVALGAVCCAAWFAMLLRVELKPYAFISLGLTVWIIYTADHLLDTRKIIGPASTERHRYHQENFRFLLGLLFVAIVSNLFVIFLMRKVVFQWGFILASVVLVYFLLQKYVRYMKEFVVAILFSCGVLLPSLALAQNLPGVHFFLLTCQFVITALLNLLLFSWFDQHNDHLDNRDSFVTLVGERKTKITCWIFFIINGILMMGSVIYFPELINKELIMLVMNVMLVMMFIRPNWFMIHERFRLIGDSIFLLPLFYLLL